MFTGIVSELGTVERNDRRGDSARLVVSGTMTAADSHLGDSIAVNGVCLTVADTDHLTFRSDVMGETLHRTSLGSLRPGDRVNLERAVTLDARLGGHLVQGHVDGVAELASREPGSDWDLLTFTCPPDLLRYMVVKGSVALDGVSLTVTNVEAASFSVGLIPTTIELTTLGAKVAGQMVNVEVDVLAKYVERLIGAHIGDKP